MYCRVIACDFDGTGASDGRLAPELAAALSRAREHGIVTLLVTGRLLEDVVTLCPETTVFDAIVAENGAVACFAGRDRTLQFGIPPPTEFLADLRRHRVPFHAGSVIVGTWESHADEVLKLIRRHALDAQLNFNRGALMILPSGINKAHGVAQVLDDFGRSAHNLIAFGDAENDLPMLALAAVGVAAHQSVPAVDAASDSRVGHPGGAGVARFVHDIIDAGCVFPTPARRSVAIGVDTAGDTVGIPSSGINVLLSGDPRSGKSWLAGWAAEQLLEQGQQLCIIDPEGDYGSLGDRPRVVVFGRGGVALPSVGALPRLLRDPAVSIVLDLADLCVPEQVTYVETALAEIESARTRSGLPHWIVIDEAQNFFRAGGGANPLLNTRSGSYLLVTYRPSQIAPEIIDCIGAHLITESKHPEERYFLTQVLQARGPRDFNAAEALDAIDGCQAGLLEQRSDGPNWRLFSPGIRVTPHVHHAHKYIDTQLPEQQAFHFLRTDWTAGFAAHNIVEFHAGIAAVPIASLRHHIGCGDFSRWVLNVLGDRHLSAGLRKLERASAGGTAVERSELLACIEAAYGIAAPFSS